MKLQAQLTAGLNTINAYDADRVVVNGQALHTSCIVTPDKLVAPWGPHSIGTLTEADMLQIAEAGCPVVLLGTGRRQQFPPAALLRPLIERQMGVEVMDSGAACRTYNILVAEGRLVAAAIILEASDNAKALDAT
jgi:uncharacterized protein